MKKMSWSARQILPKDLISCFPVKNLMSVPRVSHLIFHTSGEDIPRASLALEMICGQKPHLTRSKHFVAGFKIRADQILGTKVTLRKMQMFSCLEKFQLIFLPSKRDWTGIRMSSGPAFEKQSFFTKASQNFFKSSNIFDFGGVNFLFFSECSHQYEIFEPLHGFQIHLIHEPSEKQSFEKRSFLGFAPKSRNTLYSKKIKILSSSLQYPLE